MRIDKWLWAARFFKTRSLASRACDLGRVEWNHVPAKPSREIKAGDLLLVKTEGGEYEVEIVALSEVRGPATVAHALYRETELSQRLRQQATELRKAGFRSNPGPEGRPTKRDRRRIIQFRTKPDGG